MKRICLFALLCMLLIAWGCATVTVTKTAKGYFTPKDPDDVEILITIPRRPFIELAAATTMNWKTRDTAKMHNSLRAKCAPLGADAVILTSSGMYGKYYWANGVAIRYQD